MVNDLWQYSSVAQELKEEGRQGGFDRWAN
jgi:hypothetical protein